MYIKPLEILDALVLITRGFNILVLTSSGTSTSNQSSFLTR